MPKQQKQKQEPQMSEVFLGQPFRDDAFDTCALICNFLDAFYHQIVCMYGRYSKDCVESSSFNGILTKRCTNNKVVEYFQRLRLTLRRWLLQQRIKMFSVVLFDTEKEVVGEFKVNFYQPTVGMKRVV